MSTKRRRVAIGAGVSLCLSVVAAGGDIRAFGSSGGQESGLLVTGPGGTPLDSVDLGEARIGTDTPWLFLDLVNQTSSTLESLTFSVHGVSDDDGAVVHFVDYQAPGPGGTCGARLEARLSCKLVLQSSPMRTGGFVDEIRASYTRDGSESSDTLLTLVGGGTGDVVYAHDDTSLARGLSMLGPGVTLVLEDGDYGDVVVRDVSGTAEEPAILRSRRDGGAHVRSMDVSSVSHVRIEGIEAGLGRDGVDGHVIRVSGAQNVVFRRVTAHHAREAGNHHVWAISGSRRVTLEDCAAWGSGRIQFLYYDSELGTFRRVWGQHLHNDSETWPRTVLALYYAARSLVENSIATQALDADPGVGQIEGFKVNSRNGVRIPDDNTFRGNVAYGLQGPAFSTLGEHEFEGTRFENNVAVGPEVHHMDSSFDPSRQARGTVLRQHTSAHTTVGIGHPSSASGGARLQGTITHSIFRRIARAGRMQNVVWSLVEGIGDGPVRLGRGSRAVEDVGFDEATFGRVGAHLLRPPGARGRGPDNTDIGAEVLYRYAQAEADESSDTMPALTSTPLWPHPLEERVWRESNGEISITYEERDGRVGLGGVWKNATALERAYGRRP